MRGANRQERSKHEEGEMADVDSSTGEILKKKLGRERGVDKSIHRHGETGKIRLENLNLGSVD